MIVAKFGGTSVRDEAALERLHAIVELRRSERPLVVVSALAGVSDTLVAACAPDDPDPEPMRQAVAALESQHRQLSASATGSHTVLDPWFERAHRLVEHAGSLRAGRVVPDYTARHVHAEWLAMGELLSSEIVVAFLERRGVPARWFDARRVMRTQGTDPVEDQPDESAIQDLVDHELRHRVEQAEVVVTQGFIASDAAGRTTLLGRGGSDFTASLLGAALGAARIEIWTDVDGILTGPPRIVPGARRLKVLSFEEAAELSYFGAKVLHPATLRPAKEHDIPVLVANSRRAAEGAETGTRIVSQAALPHDERSVVRSVAIKRGITVLTVHSSRMLMAFGFLERIFAVFSRHITPVDLVSTSEVSVSLTVDDPRALEAIVAELSEIARVEVDSNMAIVCVVGADMRRTPGIAARIFRAVGNVEVRMISQGASEINVSMVVADAAVEGIVHRLHDEFFTGNLPRDVFGESFEDLESVHRQALAATHRPEPRLSGVAAELVERHGTPLYVYELDRIEAQVRRLRAALVHPRLRLAYACKANFHPVILRLMRDLGVGIDAVSPMEVERALECGIEPGAILFTANNVAPEAVIALYDRGIRVNLGAVSDARRFAAARAGAEVFLRCNPGVGDGHHEDVVTGGSDSKFGLLAEDLLLAADVLHDSGVRVVGLHAHIGSGIQEPQPLLEAARRLAELAARFPELRELNVGGGFGVPYRDDDPELDVEALGRGLAAVVSGVEAQLGRDLQLLVEPGRYLVAQAGTLIARVTCRKETAGHVYIGLDTGMNHLLRPALYGAYHAIRNLSAPSAPPEFVDVVGNICESADVFAFNRPVASPQEGHLLAIEDTGAYGFAMASHYNLWPLPREVMLRNGVEVEAVVHT